MKFILKKPETNIIDLLRKIGYHFQREDRQRGELVFYHFLGPSGYPRFHLYLKVEKNNLIFNLHLDQRRPVYKGAISHAGEYGGKVVIKEAERIKKALKEL